MTCKVDRQVAVVERANPGRRIRVEAAAWVRVAVADGAVAPALKGAVLG